MVFCVASSKTNYSVDSCGINVNLRNAKEDILPAVFKKATAISSMNNAGFQAKHIMFMFGHRCKASLKTYNRNRTDDQKRKASSVLSTISNPYHENTNKLDTSYNISLNLVSVPVSPQIPLHAPLTVTDNAYSSSPTQMEISTVYQYLLKKNNS